MLREWTPECSRHLPEQAQRRGEIEVGHSESNLSWPQVHIECNLHAELARDFLVSGVRIAMDIKAACPREVLELHLASWLGCRDNFFERSEETRLNSSHMSISYAVFCL